MSWNRWVVPPAVAAGVFATTAVAPPVHLRARGLLVSVLGEVRSGRAALVAVSLDDLAEDAVTAPHATDLTLRDRHGLAVDHLSLAGDVQASAALGQMRVAGEGPWTLTVTAAGEHARIRVAPWRAVAWTRPDRATLPVDIAVQGGALVPEIPTTVLVRAPGAALVNATSEGDALMVTPPAGETDPCGVAVFQATLRGMDAPIRVTTGAGGPMTRTRLPVDAGGLSVAWHDRTVTVRSAVLDGAVVVATGDTQGPTAWRTLRLNGDADGSTRTLEISSDAAWFAVSRSPALDHARGGWIHPPVGTEPCATAGAGMMWRQVTTALPPTGPLRRIHDGALLATSRSAAARSTVRQWSLVLLAVCIGMEAALVLVAGLGRSTAAVRPLEGTVRTRVGLIVGAVAVLLVAGFAMAIQALLGAAAE